MSFPSKLIQKDVGLSAKRLAIFKMIQDKDAFVNHLTVPISTAKDNLVAAREDLDTFSLPIFGETSNDNVTSTEIGVLQNQIDTTISILDTLKIHTDRLSGVTYDNSESDPQFKELFYVARAYAQIQCTLGIDVDAFDEVFGSQVLLDDLIDNLSVYADTIVDDIDDARLADHKSSSSSSTSGNAEYWESFTSLSSTSDYANSSTSSIETYSTSSDSTLSSSSTLAYSTSSLSSLSSLGYDITSTSSAATTSSSSSSLSNSSPSSTDLSPKAVLYEIVNR